MHTSTSSSVTAASIDTGLHCLVLLANFHGIAANPEQLEHEFKTSGSFFDVIELKAAAYKIGLIAHYKSAKPERLNHLSTPLIFKCRNGQFMILGKVDNDRLLIHNPLVGQPEIISIQQFIEIWNGDILLITSKASIAGSLAKFDFSWFIPAIIKYRKYIVEVILVSFVLHVFSLLTPLFFQVIMDKVLVHRALTTLQVVGSGLIILSLFEIVMKNLRTYVFSNVTSKIDVELGSKLFRHLLGLPLNYFQSRRSGDSVARVYELENIRNFLTGHSLTLILDAFFSIIFISVMLFYSVKLTLVVIVSIPLYFITSLLFVPVLKKRLEERFMRNAENQSFLVETLNGIDTVKSMAVEPEWARQWDRQLAVYVQASFKTTVLASIASSGIEIISKAVSIAIMWMGAYSVINGELSIGALIAFNMLSTQVSAPILRIAQLLTEFQQISISMERLGDILNTRTELSDNRPNLPKIVGKIHFNDVTFRYKPDLPPVLSGLNIAINAGETIGIVGRSGSGKSTLTRLVQRLYLPEKGQIFIDDIDIGLVEASSLRRQIGVVQQGNLLFNRSIKANIALSHPAASIEQVMQAAYLAGAHTFITELPEGYDTIVSEQGASLSGGQRQRIAIARAILSDPRILIFDEATSALDYESEQLIQKHMESICQNRTVLIIAHRLSTVRHAHRILVMDKGQIIEEGTHDVLLLKADGLYAKLWGMQEGNG
ncbi:MAG: type I secretion system permease/ATPase [Pseudomonadota bacterium]